MGPVSCAWMARGHARFPLFRIMLQDRITPHSTSAREAIRCPRRAARRPTIKGRDDAGRFPRQQRLSLLANVTQISGVTARSPTENRVAVVELELTGVRGTTEFQGNQFAFSSLCCDGFEVFYERIC
jgi:hypothetical protein